MWTAFDRKAPSLLFKGKRRLVMLAEGTGYLQPTCFFEQWGRHVEKEHRLKRGTAFESRVMLQKTCEDFQTKPVTGET